MSPEMPIDEPQVEAAPPKAAWYTLPRERHLGCFSMRLALALAFVALSYAAAALELEHGTFVFDDETPVPPVVMALEQCGAEANGYATREVFAGGFMFALRCPGNNENLMQTLIFADAQDGTGARLLHFRGPDDIRDPT